MKQVSVLTTNNKFNWRTSNSFSDVLLFVFFQWRIRVGNLICCAGSGLQQKLWPIFISVVGWSFSLLEAILAIWSPANRWGTRDHDGCCSKWGVGRAYGDSTNHKTVQRTGNNINRCNLNVTEFNSKFIKN